jgi:hypothetical protein
LEISTFYLRTAGAGGFGNLFVLFVTLQWVYDFCFRCRLCGDGFLIAHGSLSANAQSRR